MAGSGTSIKLNYFNFKGRCEHIRYLFAAADMVYDDHRIEFSDWKSIKPNTPFGSLPYLEVTTAGKTEAIGSSVAVGRFVAKLTGLYGSTPLEQAHIDEIVDCANDIREDAISMFIFVKDEAEKATKRNEYIEKANGKLASLDKIYEKSCKTMAAQASKKGRECKVFFMGEKMTWADIHFYHAVETVLPTLEGHNLLQGFPRLQQLYDNVGNDPKIKKWQEKRPKTDK